MIWTNAAHSFNLVFRIETVDISSIVAFDADGGDLVWHLYERICDNE